MCMAVEGDEPRCRTRAGTSSLIEDELRREVASRMKAEIGRVFGTGREKAISRSTLVSWLSCQIGKTCLVLPDPYLASTAPDLFGSEAINSATSLCPCRSISP